MAVSCKFLFYVKFISCLYMFRTHVLIISRSKLHYTASGIITRIGGRLVHKTATYTCDDTRDCVMQFWPTDDEHMCSKHVEASNKLVVNQKILCIKLVNYWDAGSAKRQNMFHACNLIPWQPILLEVTTTNNFKNEERSSDHEERMVQKLAADPSSSDGGRRRLCVTRIIWILV